MSRTAFRTLQTSEVSILLQFVLDKALSGRYGWKRKVRAGAAASDVGPGSKVQTEVQVTWHKHSRAHSRAHSGTKH